MDADMSMDMDTDTFEAFSAGALLFLSCARWAFPWAQRLGRLRGRPLPHMVVFGSERAVPLGINGRWSTTARTGGIRGQL